MEKKEDLKRKRSENWNEADKMLLKDLVRKRVTQIENKNTDTNSNQAKKKAWTEVEESFNNLCTGGPRSTMQLKVQWTATKVVARKQVAEHRKELAKTGGGEAPPEVGVSSSDIAVWLPNEFVVDTNEFDSDMFLHESVKIGESTPCKELQKDDEQEAPEEDKSLQAPEEDEVVQISKSRKVGKKTPAKGRSNTKDIVKKLTDFDMECKKELHELQMEAERMRIINLGREKYLIEAKIKYYENKSFGTYIFIKEEN